MIHTVEGFGIVNKAEIDVFLELSCFFDDPVDTGNLISGSSAFSQSSLNMWKFSVQVLLKPGLENFEHYFISVWDECNCVVDWAFFGIAFLRDWNENWPFPVLWPLLSFPNLLAYWVQHFHSIIFQDLKLLNWDSITSTRHRDRQKYYPYFVKKAEAQRSNLLKITEVASSRCGVWTRAVNIVLQHLPRLCSLSPKDRI